jgi:hypothetical protein
MKAVGHPANDQQSAVTIPWQSSPVRPVNLTTVPPPNPNLLDPMREALRSRHSSRQELLGYWDVRTPMTHTQVLSRGGKGVRSPADTLSHPPQEASYADPHTTSCENSFSEEKGRRLATFCCKAVLQNARDTPTGTAMLCSYTDPDTHCSAHIQRQRWRDVPGG